jgi:hypothetical protein
MIGAEQPREPLALKIRWFDRDGWAELLVLPLLARRQLPTSNRV